MGFQITLLLTVVIYVEYLQDKIPVSYSWEKAPYLLQFFVVMILVIAASLIGKAFFGLFSTKRFLVTTHTLFLYHVNSYESPNFTRGQALVSVGIAKFCNVLGCGLWRITVPYSVSKIASKKYVVSPDNPKVRPPKFNHDELSLGFKFYADMIDRICFIFVLFITVIAFGMTIVKSIIDSSSLLESYTARLNSM